MTHTTGCCLVSSKKVVYICHQRIYIINERNTIIGEFDLFYEGQKGIFDTLLTFSNNDKMKFMKLKKKQLDFINKSKQVPESQLKRRLRAIKWNKKN